ncbi:hypothetical protein PPM_0250 [Paenibacillus polymyxa M1]|nr:hypothetical protein PPM_0250 [Paenibacillus polymyxa M1]
MLQSILCDDCFFNGDCSSMFFINPIYWIEKGTQDKVL